ncbi:hypothetical protein HDG34_002376 [Paraburkholderia sp. HC6.4b]|nr:hypothetical protein [Paraburkholderia sp. HC6.4b]MBB5451545.1 hypothetical protein [Paraburkholderia sp. Kb1A]
MFKVPNQVYTAEFKAAAAQRIKDGPRSVNPLARWFASPLENGRRPCIPLTFGQSA